MCMGEGRGGSRRPEFGARPLIARGRAHFRGWDRRVTGQEVTMAHYYDNLMSLSSLPVFTQFLSHLLLFPLIVLIIICFIRLLN